MSDDFETLVAQTRIEPNNAQRTSLRNVVKKIISEMDTLKTVVNQTFGDFGTIKGELLLNLQTYQNVSRRI